jgi:hypothetical protein
MLRINLLLLLVVGFVPVPTRLLAEYLDSAEGERVAVTFYGVALPAIAVALYLAIAIYLVVPFRSLRRATRSTARQRHARLPRHPRRAKRGGRGFQRSTSGLDRVELWRSLSGCMPPRRGPTPGAHSPVS